MVFRARVSSAQVEDVQLAPSHPYDPAHGYRELPDAALQSLVWDTEDQLTFQVQSMIQHPLPATPVMKVVVVLLLGMKMSSFPNGGFQAPG
jgi:hypothetical protein